LFWQKPGVRSPVFVEQGARQYFIYGAISLLGKGPLLFINPVADRIKRSFTGYIFCSQVAAKVKAHYDLLLGKSEWIVVRDHAKQHVSAATKK
jgi:hypothetical protein